MLRLLQHLVKFGYYSDIDDVKHLLTPLLSLLDGRHDVPFPKDKSKGKGKSGSRLFKTSLAKQAHLAVNSFSV